MQSKTFRVPPTWRMYELHMVCVCVCVCVFTVVYSFQLLNGSLCSSAAIDSPSCWVIRWNKSEVYKLQMSDWFRDCFFPNTPNFKSYFPCVFLLCCHARVCTISVISPRHFPSVWALPDSENHKALTQFSHQHIPHLCRSLFLYLTKLTETKEMLLQITASTDSRPQVLSRAKLLHS